MATLMLAADKHCGCGIL